MVLKRSDTVPRVIPYRLENPCPSRFSCVVVLFPAFAGFEIILDLVIDVIPACLSQEEDYDDFEREPAPAIHRNHLLIRQFVFLYLNSRLYLNIFL